MTIHGITTSDGVTLNLESRGEGPAIVFVGGYAVSLATWHDQVVDRRGKRTPVAG